MKILKSIKEFFFKEKKQPERTKTFQQLLSEEKKQSEESKSYNEFLSDKANDLGNKSKKL